MSLNHTHSISCTFLFILVVVVVKGVFHWLVCFLLCQWKTKQLQGLKSPSSYIFFSDSKELTLGSEKLEEMMTNFSAELARYITAHACHVNEDNALCVVVWSLSIDNVLKEHSLTHFLQVACILLKQLKLQLVYSWQPQIAGSTATFKPTYLSY